MRKKVELVRKRTSESKGHDEKEIKEVFDTAERRGVAPSMLQTQLDMITKIIDEEEKFMERSILSDRGTDTEDYSNVLSDLGIDTEDYSNVGVSSSSSSSMSLLETQASSPASAYKSRKPKGRVHSTSQRNDSIRTKIEDNANISILPSSSSLTFLLERFDQSLKPRELSQWNGAIRTEIEIEDNENMGVFSWTSPSRRLHKKKASLTTSLNQSRKSQQQRDPTSDTKVERNDSIISDIEDYNIGVLSSSSSSIAFRDNQASSRASLDELQKAKEQKDVTVSTNVDHILSQRNDSTITDIEDPIRNDIEQENTNAGLFTCVSPASFIPSFMSCNLKEKKNDPSDANDDHILIQHNDSTITDIEDPIRNIIEEENANAGLFTCASPASFIASFISRNPLEKKKDAVDANDDHILSQRNETTITDMEDNINVGVLSRSSSSIVHLESIDKSQKQKEQKGAATGGGVDVDRVLNHRNHSILPGIEEEHTSMGVFNCASPSTFLHENQAISPSSVDQSGKLEEQKDDSVDADIEYVLNKFKQTDSIKIQNKSIKRIDEEISQELSQELSNILKELSEIFSKSPTSASPVAPEAHPRKLSQERETIKEDTTVGNEKVIPKFRDAFLNLEESFSSGADSNDSENTDALFAKFKERRDNDNSKESQHHTTPSSHYSKLVPSAQYSKLVHSATC